MTDRLHETGCRLHGRPMWRDGSSTTLNELASTYRNAGAKYCGKCWDRYDHAGIDAEITRRSLAAQPVQGGFKLDVGAWVEWDRSDGVRMFGKWKGRSLDMVDELELPSGGVWYEACVHLRPWSPQPGEMCEGETCSMAGKFRSGPYVGILPRFPDTVELGDTSPGTWKVRLATLRPAPARPAESTQIIGIDRASGPDHDVMSWRCRSCMRVMVREGSAALTEADFTCGDCAAKPSAPEPPKPAERDPYAEHDEPDDHSMSYDDFDSRSKRIAALRASTHPLDRLAASRAKRSAHLDAHKAALDVSTDSRRSTLGQAPCVLARTERRVEWVDGHPRGWPEGSGE